jgi:hypothetical protein
MFAKREDFYELNRTIESINAWLNFSQATFNYQLVLADIWSETFKNVAQKLPFYLLEGEIPSTWQDFFKLWASIFDHKFAQKLRTEDAVLLQGRFLKAAINYWSYQPPVIKDCLQFLEVPAKINPINFLSYLYEDKIQIGVTPKLTIYREDKVVLYRFTSMKPSLNIPVLIVYALVNRPDIVDLQEGRSLVANLLNLGLDVYLIDWRYPSQDDRSLTMDKYINGYINNCVDIIRDRHSFPEFPLSINGKSANLFLKI